MEMRMIQGMKVREIRRYENEGEGDREDITKDCSTPILLNESESKNAA